MEQFIRRHYMDVLKIYFQEQQQKGEGCLFMEKRNEKIDVSYRSIYEIDDTRVTRWMKEKQDAVESSGGLMDVENKLMISLPFMEYFNGLPPIYIIYFDRDVYPPIKTLFHGVAQVVHDNKIVKSQYVLIADADPTELIDGWTVAGTERGKKYFAVCQKAVKDLEIFNTFRADPDFTEIVVVGKHEEGQVYLTRLLESSLKDKIELFQENDRYGGPNLDIFKDVEGNDILFSVDTLRYTSILLDILDNFKIDSEQKLKIIEIGGSYGGLAHVLSNHLSIEKYVLVETEEVLKLAKKYLWKNGVENVEYKMMKDLASTVEYDLVISDYGICELEEAKMTEYMEKVVKKSEMCYFSMNIWDKKRRTWFMDKLRLIYDTCYTKQPAYINMDWLNYMVIGKREKADEKSDS